MKVLAMTVKKEASYIDKTLRIKGGKCIQNVIFNCDFKLKS